MSTPPVVRAQPRAHDTDAPTGQRKPVTGRRWVRLGAWFVVVVLALGAGWWAARATAPEQTVAGSGPVAVNVAVTEGTVGRSIDLAVGVERPVAVVATNLLAGVVTATHPEGELTTGGVLYAVAGVPVRVVASALPFWRDLAPGVAGADVEALQRSLSTMGLLSITADGKYGSKTVAAVTAWQKLLGIPATGTVPLGELVAVPALPSQVLIDKVLAPGRVATVGTGDITAPTGEVNFSIVTAGEQAATIPTDSTVTVRFESAAWAAVIEEITTNDNGDSVLRLTAPGGGDVCGPDCGALPASATSTASGTIEITPPVSGPSVPAAAVRTAPDGSTYVQRPDSTRVPVTVKGSSKGIVVVDGIRPGELVRVLDSPSRSS